jgi:hypothetical protein
MKKAKERFKQYYASQFRQASNKLLDLTLARLDYPDFDPDRAELITRRMIAAGRLAFDTPDRPARGICV